MTKNTDANSARHKITKQKNKGKHHPSSNENAWEDTPKK